MTKCQQGIILYSSKRKSAVLQDFFRNALLQDADSSVRDEEGVSGKYQFDERQQLVRGREVHKTGIIENGKLIQGSLNLCCGAMLLVISVVVLLKKLQTKREAED